MYYAIGRNIAERKKLRQIIHEKKTPFGKSCVTLTDLMVKFYGETELSDAIYEEWSKSSGKISKPNFKTKQSVLKQPMHLRIFLQISEYNYKRDEYYKNKTKIPLQPNIPCLFQI